MPTFFPIKMKKPSRFSEINSEIYLEIIILACESLGFQQELGILVWFVFGLQTEMPRLGMKVSVNS